MRLLERIEAVYALGDRIGYSPEEDRAHELAAGWMREAGLAVEVDAAGNLVGTRGDARVWTGSHLDSVPNGGRYDGVLGVLAGIEAAERIDAPIGVVAFRDEERGFGGSRGLVRKPEIYVEVHIEQGPVLLRREEPLSVDARAPDRERLDALVAAIGFEPLLVSEPVAMDDEVRTVLREELERRGLPAPELVSGAGHDAGVLAAAGVRCGMLFVRSGAGGVSHSPDEHSDPEDIELAVEVLAAALSRLAE